MGRKNKKGIALLYTIISIVLSIMLITTGIHAVNKLFKKSVDNSDKLEELVQISDKMLADTSFFSQSKFFELGTKELFMFFSSGQDSIFLKHNVKPDLYLEFARPDLPACKDKSCVCYCNEGPYWESLEDEEPYIQKNKLLSGEVYTCQNPVCDSISGHVIFANSRGWDSYDEKMDDLIELYNDDQYYSESYFPIPMDIPLLLQIGIDLDVNNEDNIFFSTKPGDDYNREQQESQYVEPLQDFFWKGGVVIGGMGYAKDSDDEDNHQLSGPKINLVLKQPVEDKNIIGVCLELEDCIVQEHLTSLENNLHVMEVKQNLLGLTTQLDLYSQQHLVPCMQKAGGLHQANDCVDSFQPLLENLFNQVPQGYNLYAESNKASSDLKSLLNVFLKNSKSTDEKLAEIPLDLPKLKILEGGKLLDSSDKIIDYENSKGFILSSSKTKRYNFAAAQIGSGKDLTFVLVLRSLADEKSSEGK